MKRNIYYAEKLLQYIFRILSVIYDLIFVNKKNNLCLCDFGRYIQTNKISNGIKNYISCPASLTISFYFIKGNIEIKILYKKRYILKHMSNVATSGLDVYIYKNNNYKWITCIAPNNNYEMFTQEIIKIKEEGLVYIFLPPFAEIEKIYLEAENNYIQILENSNADIVVYGSSITQGCAASRPGLSYVNQLKLYLNKNVLNFGFSESAKGEEEILKYIASIKATVYILEFDHNATVELLRERHLECYKTIRYNNVNSLIIFISRFSGGISISEEEEKEREKIINNTYNYALNNNDKNVEFINGRYISKKLKNSFFVDDRHPNDIGMYIIAKKIYNVIKRRKVF